ncbi:MAG: hypothetical protein RL375_4729, partial [Pseudomonadota bacterium]
TPGTNASTSDDEQRLNTPITRLARKFAALLRSRGTPADDEARLKEIAARLREEVGFAQLVDLYSHELDAPPGPDPKDARFLFVIDQFEELFHPTTRQSKDARELVERVIDHFFSPHPRCYIVLTMRSEHLNDCAGFLELPDAINKSSYLVRRLDDSELTDAIVKPPRRLLRLKKLADEGGARLPSDVEVDEAVIARLVHDARQISDDPDHLPLLQHALARTWQAASQRVAGQLDLPDRLTVDDLAVATCGSARDATTSLAKGVNVLRASVEHWAQAAYERHDKGQREQLDLLLPRLGVRDPNTGMYSQQRIQVGEFAAQLGPGRTPADLKKLVADGFLGEVNYLYWDDDDPTRITLKVSHESLIRGWSRLRGAIDEEAERFEEFVGLLRKCDKWQRSQRAASQLLVDAELQRVGHARLDPVLGDVTQRQAWFARLGATAAYDGLNEQDGAVDEFVRLSRQQAEAAHEQERKRKRNKGLLWIGGALLLPPTFMFGLILGPLFNRTELLTKSSVQAARYIPERQTAIGSQAEALKALMQAAANIDRAREGSADTLQLVNRWLLDHLAGAPFFSGRVSLFNRAAAISDSSVNAKLRRLLTSSVWRTPWPDTLAAGAVTSTATQQEDFSCDFLARGRLLSWATRSGIRRWLFLPRPGTDEAEPEVNLYTVTVDPKDATCKPTQLLRPNIGFDFLQAPGLVFDDQLRYVWVLDAEAEAAATATLFEIDSVLSNKQGERRTRTVRRTQLQSVDDVGALRRAIDTAAWPNKPKGAVLASVRMEGGRALKVGDQAWRIVDTMAQPVQGKEAFTGLGEAAAGSPCDRLREQLKKRTDPGSDVTMQVDATNPGHCFAIYTRVDEARFLTSIGVEVYASPSADDLAQDQPSSMLASIERFTRAPLQGDRLPDIEWSVGSGKYAGWLQTRFKNLTGSDYYTAAAPWSTCALYRFGHEVLETPGDKMEKGVCVGR